MIDEQNEQTEKCDLMDLKEKYLDLLIQIPLSYQTHEMVAIRNRIAELKKELAEKKSE